MALALIRIMLATLAVTRVAAVRRDSGHEEVEIVSGPTEGGEDERTTMGLQNGNFETTLEKVAIPAVVDAAGQPQVGQPHSLVSVAQNASIEPVTATIGLGAIGAFLAHSAIFTAITHVTAGGLAAIAAKIVGVTMIADQGKKLICTLTGKMCNTTSPPVDTNLIGQYGTDGQGQGSQYGGR
eukprot:TRINITY_DN6364_c0_g1_i1.p1 TRINITY_DN6364_c0_g1~~TRINITY_DN6364_c0_g1_i1.p1  ORF type:complete len:182 (-),score=4.13 TRINITY_DN6364_c0_g1_i1:211-756(-)